MKSSKFSGCPVLSPSRATIEYRAPDGRVLSPQVFLLFSFHYSTFCHTILVLIAKTVNVQDVEGHWQNFIQTDFTRCSFCRGSRSPTSSKMSKKVSVYKFQDTLGPGTRARLTCLGNQPLPRAGSQFSLCQSNQQWKPDIGRCQ